MGLPRETIIYDSIAEPWYQCLEDPAESQGKTLIQLVSRYARTRYGEEHSAADVGDIEVYRRRFPKVRYRDLKDLLDEVRRGRFEALLSEPPLYWVMTRGSTGVSKIIPATKTHLGDILSCGARAVANYILKRGDLELTGGRILNLSLPSRVAEMEVDGRTQPYGYSSGTYSRIFPSLGKAALAPTQEDIDSAGLGLTKGDWARRFELIYRETKDEKITAAIGVAPVVLSFARYVKKRYGEGPKELWKTRAIFCTSVRKIQFRYAPLFRKYFGETRTVEMYTATEGVYAQQLDDLPYVSPNYDKYLFEVETGGGVKMLHELRRGEWGRLIVSSCMFPRYEIGDMIEAMGKNYFRVFGRDKLNHVLEHRLYRLLFGWFL